MTAYRDYISDYPSRCHSLLNNLYASAQAEGHEVTFLLSMATSGFLIPYCRLQEEKHPSDDRNNYAHYRDAFESLNKEQFLGSRLHPSENSQSWRFGNLSEIIGDPDNWAYKHSQPLANEKSRKRKNSCVLHIIRNALAHGNIFTRSSSPITEIIFVSRKAVDTEGYYFIVVSPDDFMDFISNWFIFLQHTGIPNHISNGELLELIA